MKATTLPRFLFGSRSAIVEVAHSPWAIVCGVLFTISAGFAREYDGEDLLHEPWHALRPLGASLVSGTALFLLVHLVAMMRSSGEQPRPTIFAAYRTFMGLFWMTAPLAWLYAIPYERFLSPVEAVQVNLWTLALVATWRVLLITRIISVVYGARWLPTFTLVMLYADIVTIAAVFLAPMPVIDVMGGLRQTEREAIVASATFTIRVLSVISAPVWLLAALIGAVFFHPSWPRHEHRAVEAKSRGLLVLAAASVLIWTPALVVTQPEQMRKRQVERFLSDGRIAEALAYMSNCRESDFPPGWEPPPHMGTWNPTPRLILVRAAIRDQQPADWVLEIYLAKTRREIAQMGSEFGMGRDVTDFARNLDRVVERSGDSEFFQATLRLSVDAARFLIEHDRSLSTEDIDALTRIIDLASGMSPIGEPDR